MFWILESKTGRGRRLECEKTNVSSTRPNLRTCIWIGSTHLIRPILPTNIGLRWIAG